MKNLKNFILEGKKHVDTATVADFYQWACQGELPTGKADSEIINKDDIESLIDNGWFEHFEGDNATKDAAEWFKKNWDKQIKVVSEETKQDWEISFKLDGKEYAAAFVTYFGDIEE